MTKTDDEFSSVSMLALAAALGMAILAYHHNALPGPLMTAIRWALTILPKMSYK